ncbi:sigma-54-dependent transcriptional regulator [Ideonella sp. BN130291]|uniref:sigma-54-dependent transcriptional regulator n=1 Tax=Ideonella sp. BN130291 TaxID=3112940 RepID=UPI002E274CEC|nr:sigma-54 dependent transcriptional regulator [Ideonella sp. BN130291]
MTAATTSAEVLLVEDDLGVQMAAAQTLRLGGFQVSCCTSAEEALRRIGPGYAGIVISDVRLPGRDGLALLRELRRTDPELPVALVTGHGDVAMAVEAMREGAWDFIEKPFSSDRLNEVARRAHAQRRLVLENRRLKAALGGGAGARLLGTSAAMEHVRTLVATLGAAGVDVLIEGETGTGKELVARALHDASGASGPFVAINCGALPETVFEAEIFGAEPGAYTGASKRRIGRLEHAGDGTVFLDEIESMPLAGQVKLLRVLQERTVERLGSNTSVPLQCRVVAATKVDLRKLAAQGRFRDDLYYRLNVATVSVPPLRARREDIPLLLTHFAEAAALRFGRPVPQWSAAQLSEWQLREWPGNVRELHNFADRWVLGVEAASDAMALPADTGLCEQVDAFERSLIDKALRQAQGSVARAAEALAVPRKTLHDKLKRLGLVVQAYRAGHSHVDSDEV